MAKILVIQNSSHQLGKTLNVLGNYRKQSLGVSSPQEALDALKKQEFNIVISDLHFPDMDDTEFIGTLRRENPRTHIILIVSNEDKEIIKNARLMGIKAFLKKPYIAEELLNHIETQLNIIELKEENRRLRDRMTANQLAYSVTISSTEQEELPDLPWNNKNLIACIETAKKIARHRMNAIIYGEDGTGKSTLAQFIHRHGKRAGEPFIRINCHFLPDDYFHSLCLFLTSGDNHKSAFGSDFFKGISRGTLFFENLPELSFSNKRGINDLLSLIPDHNKKAKISPRLIFATEEHPSRLIREDKMFREFFHRLNPGLIELPPLRNRPDDFEMIFSYFLEKLSRELHISAEFPTRNEFVFLKTLPWKKNLRELKNFVKKWLVFGKEKVLDDIKHLTHPDEEMPSLKEIFFRFEHGNMEELQRAKIWLVKRAMRKYDGNKTHAARHLGITYQGLLKILGKISP